MKRYFYIFLIPFILLLVFFIPSLRQLCDVGIYKIYQRLSKPIVTNNLILISASSQDFQSKGIWPWGKKWPYYFLSYLLDWDIKGIILTPEFIKKLHIAENHYNIRQILDHDKIYLTFNENNFIKGINYHGHLSYHGDRIIKIPVYLKKNNKNYPFIAYIIESKKALSLPQNFKFKFLVSSKILYPYPQLTLEEVALGGFLKESGYYYEKFESLLTSGKWVLVGLKDENLNLLAGILNAAFNAELKLILAEHYLLISSLIVLLLLFFVIKFFAKSHILHLTFTILLTLFFSLHYVMWQKFSFWLAPSSFFSLLIFGYMQSVAYIYIRNKEKRRKREETKLARVIKEKEIFPASTVKLEGLILSVTRYRSETVGGDFYQFLEFPNRELGIIVGWVPGEGLKRVEYILEVIQNWRNNASLYKEPNKVFQVMNNNLFQYAENGNYVSCLYMLIDAKKRIVKYSNAGHDPVIVVSPKDEFMFLQTEEPTPLGIARDIIYPEKVLHLNPGSLLIAYSGRIFQDLKEQDPKIIKIFELIKDRPSDHPTHLADEIFHEMMRQFHGKIEEEWFLLLIKIEDEKRS